MNRLLAATALSILFLSALPAAAETLDDKLHHLRSGKTREWSEFPAAAESDRRRPAGTLLCVENFLAEAGHVALRQIVPGIVRIGVHRCLARRSVLIQARAFGDRAAAQEIRRRQGRPAAALQAADAHRAGAAGYG